MKYDIFDVFNILDNDYAKVDIKDKTNAHIHFAPSIEQQKEMALLLNKDKSADQGIAGQFIVEYDVERDPQGGEVIVSFLTIKSYRDFELFYF